MAGLLVIARRLTDYRYPVSRFISSSISNSRGLMNVFPLLLNNHAIGNCRIDLKSVLHTSSNYYFCLTDVNLAGHSKWQNIRHIKGAKDAQKANLNSRYVREIANAIKEGNGPDPKFNVLLARVIERAGKDDVPKQTIQNALKRATEGKVRKTFYYDMRGPGNCALIVETYTDNTVKMKCDLAAATKKLNCRFGDSNKFFFDKKGMIYLPAASMSFEQAEELAIEAGAEEVEYTEDNNEKLYKFICADQELFMVKKMFELKNIEIIRYETEYLPTVFTKVTQEGQKALIELINKLESFDDVVKVYDNVEVE